MRGDEWPPSGRPEGTRYARAPPLGAAARGPEGADHHAREARPGGLPAWPA